MSDPHHFPFNPWRVRVGFFACAVLSSLPGALALRSLLHAGGMSAALRAALCVGLCLASFWMGIRLRPSLGWGVTLDAESLTLTRRTGPPLVIPWKEVETARVTGEKRSQVVVLWGDSRRLLVTQHLFARKDEFQAFARALEGRVPPPVYDA
jgi:hypothetical protein